MPEEKKESQETATVDKTTDEAMSTAFDKMTEEKEILQTQPKKEIDDEEPDQQERTRLGRRLKRMEEQFGQIIDKIDTLGSRQYVLPKDATETGDDLPEYVATGKDVADVVKRMYPKLKKEDLEKEQSDKEKYESGYVNNFRKLGLKDGDLYEEIFNEMFTNFNNTHTGDPTVDSRINYAEAKASIMAKKVATPNKQKSTTKGERTQDSMDLSVTTRETTHVSEMPPLDDFAKEFMAKTGMKDESAKAALAGDSPIHLSKVR